MVGERFSAYARVSTSEQETIEFQKRTIDDYAKIKGLVQFDFYYEKIFLVLGNNIYFPSRQIPP